jgi:hypothetical protein
MANKNFKMGIASVTAISCGHMLHYIKLLLMEVEDRSNMSKYRGSNHDQVEK